MPTTKLTIRVLGLYLATTLLVINAAAAAPEREARAFLASQNLGHAAGALSHDEMMAIGRTLEAPNRRLTNDALANLLRNPVAWRKQDNARGLLGTILKSLPDIAATKGINSTIKLASNNNMSNFRGYGVEMIGSAALSRYITVDGDRARVTRMGGMIKGVDGRHRESDGSALLGADGVPRLVTIKSVSTPKAVSTSMKKAADQLALRNFHRDGSRSPGVILVGYDSPAVLQKLRRKDWQAAADRTGAKLLVLGINQRKGTCIKLASHKPDPNSKVQPKRPGPPPPLSKRIGRFLMQQIGKRHPPTAIRISRVRRAWKAQTHRFKEKIQAAFRPLKHGFSGAR